MHTETQSQKVSEWSIYGLLLFVHMGMVIASSASYYRMLQQDNLSLGEALGLVFMYALIVMSALVITLTLAAIGLKAASSHYPDFPVLYTIKQVFRWILSFVAILYAVVGYIFVFKTAAFILSYTFTFIIGFYSIYVLLSMKKKRDIQ